MKYLVGIVILGIMLVPLAMTVTALQVETHNIEGEVGIGSIKTSFEGNLYRYSHWYLIDANVHYLFYSAPFRAYLVNGEVYGYASFLGSTYNIRGTYIIDGSNATISWICGTYRGYASGHYL